MAPLLAAHPRAARLFALLALVLGLALPAAAQEALPAPAHTSVNDFAGVLIDADAQAIDEALIALNRATGIEGTVVTLPDRARYGGEALDAFGRRLFDAWGVGDAARNDGFMLLMLTGPREIRVTFGAGYGRGLDAGAEAVVQRRMLPLARAGDLSGALREGTLGLVQLVAPAGAAAPARPAPSGGGLLPLAAFGIIGFAGFGILRGLLRGRRVARCPQCGGPVVAADTLLPAPLPGGAAAAQREVTRRCPACGWQARQILPVAVSGADRDRGWRRGIAGPRWGGGGGGRSGGFGGGRSGGGGASGRW